MLMHRPCHRESSNKLQIFHQCHGKSRRVVLFERTKCGHICRRIRKQGVGHQEKRLLSRRVQCALSTCTGWYHDQHPRDERWSRRMPMPVPREHSDCWSLVLLVTILWYRFPSSVLAGHEEVDYRHNLRTRFSRSYRRNMRPKGFPSDPT